MRTFPCLAQGARDPADRARQGPRAVLADHAFVIPIPEAADDTVVRAEPTLRREE
ncbi:hypothetical protein AB0H37_23225 [Actinomadura sp. NPDC023710]|uniref:hypothetical protein n=1 Tax=Actinomadura sp. NPDC023710 TaxID=3158219 RepID=UPI0033D370E3